MSGRPAVPKHLERAVKIEAGHRCAIATCRQWPVELAHIVPWADVQEHTFENLIALCPTCHTRYDRGEIDRLAMQQYKANLGIVNSRYGEFERRLLEMFAASPGAGWAEFDTNKDFELYYLMRDGLLVHDRSNLPEGATPLLGGHRYALTELGRNIVRSIAAGRPVDAA